MSISFVLSCLVVGLILTVLFLPMGVGVALIARDRARLDARARANLLPTEAETISGWAYSPLDRGYELTRALSPEWRARIWWEGGASAVMLHIDMTREGGDTREGLVFELDDLEQEARIGEDGISRLRIDAPRASVSCHGASMPLTEAFIREQALSLSEAPPIEQDRLWFAPGRAEVGSEGFTLHGMLKGQVTQPEFLDAVEEQLLAYAAIFRWREGVRPQDVLSRALASTGSLDSQPGIRIALGELYEGDEREDYWVARVLRAPRERVVARHAFRALVEDGRREKLFFALRGAPIALHEWLVLNKEIEALRWVIDDVKEEAKWLDFFLKQPPNLSLRYDRSEQTLKAHNRIFELLPNSLLANPHVDASTRRCILEMAAKSWPTRRYFALIEALCYTLDGPTHYQFLKHMVRKDANASVVAIVTTLERFPDPAPEVCELTANSMLKMVNMAPRFFGDKQRDWAHRCLDHDNPHLRRAALDLAGEIGNEHTLQVLLDMKKSGASRLDAVALARATAKVAEAFGHDMEQHMGQLTLASSQGGELTVASAQGGELELSDPS